MVYCCTLIQVLCIVVANNIMVYGIIYRFIHYAQLIKGFKFCTQQLIVISHPIICNYLYKILIKILSKILAFANKPVSNCS